MKIHQIIVEYRRDVTAKNLGDKIIYRLKDYQHGVVDLYDATQLVRDSMGKELQQFGNLHYNRSNNSLYGHFGMPSKNSVNVNKKGYNPKRYDVLNYRVAYSTPVEAREALSRVRDRIINYTLQFIESRDPTPNKQYTQWLTRVWANDDSIRLEDLNRHSFLTKYDSAKRRNVLDPEDRDINRFRTYKEFERKMMKYPPELLDPELAQQLKNARRGEAKLIADTDEYRIIRPKDRTAACYYGRGTIWCTAGTDFNMFDSYDKDGELFIILPKNQSYPNEKYQVYIGLDKFFNPEYEFRDKNDDEVTKEFLQNRYKDVFDYIFNYHWESSDK